MTVMVVYPRFARDFFRETVAAPDQIRGRLFRRSEPLGPQQGVGQVKQQAEGNEARERIIEDHGRSP